MIANYAHRESSLIRNFVFVFVFWFPKMLLRELEHANAPYHSLLFLLSIPHILFQTKTYYAPTNEDAISYVWVIYSYFVSF